jgi:hypothetical protein
MTLFLMGSPTHRSTQSYISSKWGLSKGRIQNGGANLAFVKDPFPAPGDTGNNNNSATANSSSPVLQAIRKKGNELFWLIMA